MSVIEVGRSSSVTLLRYKLVSTGVETLFRAVIANFRKNIGQLAVYVKQILSVFALGTR